jgi:hypothetical protein
MPRIRAKGRSPRSSSMRVGVPSRDRASGWSCENVRLGHLIGVVQWIGFKNSRYVLIVVQINRKRAARIYSLLTCIPTFKAVTDGRFSFQLHGNIAEILSLPGKWIFGYPRCILINQKRIHTDHTGFGFGSPSLDWFFEDWYGRYPERIVPMGITYLGDPEQGVPGATQAEHGTCRSVPEDGGLRQVTQHPGKDLVSDQQ